MTLRCKTNLPIDLSHMQQYDGWPWSFSTWIAINKVAPRFAGRVLWAETRKGR